jgi:hypothetical protein
MGLGPGFVTGGRGLRQAAYGFRSQRAFIAAALSRRIIFVFGFRCGKSIATTPQTG